jgi:hypothetical protein
MQFLIYILTFPFMVVSILPLGSFTGFRTLFISLFTTLLAIAKNCQSKFSIGITSPGRQRTFNHRKKIVPSYVRYVSGND